MKLTVAGEITVPPEIVHTELLKGSMLISAGSFDGDPSAVAS
jgi:hypothetical protein